MLIEEWGNLLQLLVDQETEALVSQWFSVLGANGPVRPTLPSDENMESLKRKLAVMLTLAYNCLLRAMILLVRKDSAIVASAPAEVSSNVLTEARTDFARKVLLKQLSGASLCLASGQDRLVTTKRAVAFMPPQWP
jgi:hypothetical protein